MTLIEGIQIDLESREDLESLKDAHIYNFTNDYYSETYKFNRATDLSILTGKAKYSNYNYLKDVNKSDNYCILYAYIDSVVSDDITRENKLNNYNRYSRQFLIRPVLRFDDPKLFDKLTYPHENDKGEKLKYTRIKLGWAPRYVANKTTQYRLKEAYKKHLLVKTNNVYTFDSIYVIGPRSLTKPFKPVQYPVYEFEGKRFIRYKVFNCYPNDSIKLSDNIRCHNGEYVWVEVSKIPWIVDIERKVLIAQEGLLSGIQYENFNKNFNPIDYSSSNIKWYLDTYMKQELLINEPLLCKENKPIVQNNEKSKTLEITTLLNKIQQYQKYYFGNIDIETRVKDLLNNYNKELDSLSKNINHDSKELSLKTNNPNLLYQRLIIDLEEILYELKTHGEKVKNYHDMIDILNECKKDDIDSDKDELCNMVNSIKTIIFEFITNSQTKEKLKSELNLIIDKNINQNKIYIEEFKHNDNVKTKSLDELKLEFRRDLHPFIENKLVDIVKRQDIVNEIMNNVRIMIDNHFTESKNKLVGNYLKILNNIISKIKEIGQEEDINKLNDIASLNLDVNDDISEIIKKLETMIIKAYKIELDIEERLAKNKEIDNLRINVDIASIFNDNNKIK